MALPALPTVAILAGGLAQRMRPLTEAIPKAMLPVAGVPFIAHQLRWLAAQGGRRVVICTGHLGAALEAFVGDGAAFGLEVRYSPDGPTLLGTGGALRQALPLLGEPFILLYGDSYTPVALPPLVAAFQASGRPALMAYLRNEGRWDRSNVLAEAGRLVRYDKHAPTPDMAHVDYGIAVLSARVFSGWPPQGPFDLADVYHDVSLRGELAGFEVQERFWEIGSPQGLRETEARLAREGDG